MKRQNRITEFIDQTLNIVEQDARDASAMGFLARALVMATLPHSNPKTQQFERRNGNYTLTITALRKGIGLPYGSIPRLVLAWICTEATRTQSRELVLGDSLSAWMAELGLVPTGGRWGTITRLRDQMQRLFSCAFSIAYTDEQRAAGVNTLIAQKYNLWWNHREPGQRSLFPSTLTLSEDFYREIIEHPVPLDIRALRVLKRSPMALDIYAWLNWRLFYVRQPVCIPWEGLQAQFGAGYPTTPQGMRDFRKKFLAALRKVVCVLPNAQVEMEKAGLILLPSRPAIRPKR